MVLDPITKADSDSYLRLMMLCMACGLYPPRMLQSVGTTVFTFYKLKVANRIHARPVIPAPGEAKIGGTANLRPVWATKFNFLWATQQASVSKENTKRGCSSQWNICCIAGKRPWV